MEGTTGECLRHFFSELDKVDGNKQSHLADDFLRFVGVSNTAATSWFKGTYFPRGIELLKVRYFLRQRGYVPLETKGLDPALDTLGKLIASGVIDPARAAADLGFPDVAEMLRLLHGTRNTSATRKEKIAKYCEPFQEDLRGNEVHEQGTAAFPAKTAGDRMSSVTALLSIVENAETLLMPELDILLGSTSEERQQLRSKTGDLFFRLSNKTHELKERLNALCSEKSRELYSNKKGGA